jgi:hypothetical protein
MMTEHQWDRLEHIVRLLGQRDRLREKESREQMKKLKALWAKHEEDKSKKSNENSEGED